MKNFDKNSKDISVEKLAQLIDGVSQGQFYETLKEAKVQKELHPEEQIVHLNYGFNFEKPTVLYSIFKDDKSGLSK